VTDSTVTDYTSAGGVDAGGKQCVLTRRMINPPTVKIDNFSFAPQIHEPGTYAYYCTIHAKTTGKS
jgi:plastocyanin